MVSRKLILGFVILISIWSNPSLAVSKGVNPKKATTQSTSALSGEQGFSHRFGAGVIVGSPTALTGKYWFSNLEALDFGLSFFIDRHLLIYGDYLWHMPGLFGHETRFISQLLPYIGAGGGIYFWSDRSERPRGWSKTDDTVGLYGRIPFGVEWSPRSPPLGVFVELVPIIEIIPGTTLGFNAGVGIRYYF